MPLDYQRAYRRPARSSWRDLPATPSQLRYLASLAGWPDVLHECRHYTRGQAHDLIAELRANLRAENAWRRRTGRSTRPDDGRADGRPPADAVGRTPARR